MVTGIAGFLLAGCFGPLPGIVALVLGLTALSQIKKSPEKFGGKPYATAGVIIGARQPPVLRCDLPLDNSERRRLVNSLAVV